VQSWVSSTCSVVNYAGSGSSSLYDCSTARPVSNVAV
jgi:hypothetical protein